MPRLQALRSAGAEALRSSRGHYCAGRVVQVVLAVKAYGAVVSKAMKTYPSQILLTVPEPGTGRDTLRWFPVESAEHEAKVRNYVKLSKERIAAARVQLIEFKRRENARALDAEGSTKDQVVRP